MRSEDLGLPLEAGEAIRLALSLFGGNELATKNWLNTPAIALSGIKPVELLVSDAGRQQVVELIWKLENGVSI
ncbi:DUF2384 domain-containing protein [Pseudomonas putida]|uniref:MbcA/ParS/Xre antitoxin family protein n=1 Tax=Pseudomonas monteilii TaxID=76759 RepID=UPI001F42F3AB|nr:MbcA/ParS/Xre antitoxin family protein [Pseudomonas monteilii]EKT4476341.1 DUF2384 domain-containing protein [Pseudomonas putida]